MRLNLLLNISFILLVFNSSGQTNNVKNYRQLSCPEKWWVIWHPFVAKRAYSVTKEVRKIVDEVKKDSLLVGDGNALQLDAFRHTYWMAILTKEIGWRKAKKLGRAHEKGNYKDYKKRRDEDGVIPDKISSEMDLFNNNIGINMAKQQDEEGFLDKVINAVKEGKCKIIKMDKYGNYLDCDGNIILPESLKGKWENNKCLVNSNVLQ
jgi:hypothetical protein